MDPLSVLGVVAAVVQFVDFSSTLLSRSFAVYTSKSGELQYDEERRVAIAKTLRDLNEEIKRSSTTAVRTTVTDQTESDLLVVCNGCGDVAEELLIALGKLRVNKAKRKEWESFRVALQSIWNGDALDRLEQRLSAYQQQISLHILWGMRKQLQGGLQNLAQEQKRTREEIVKLVGRRRDWKESVVAAIGTAPLLGVKPDALNQDKFVQLILRHLHFESISNREGRIPSAHQATFEWVFMPPRTDQSSWTDFGEWLESDSSMYWITGKPGSGKSTLMKFIGNDERTTKMLRKSAAGRRLVIARFYFWNSGVELQMTEEGLLRTLIHDIFQQCNDLAIKTFPHQWELFQLFGIFDSESLDCQGLKHQLDQIIMASPSTQFVFFIDGLDEFFGDRSDLAENVKRLSDNPNTKVCASSRPWNEFEDAFASSPSLRVEDLTYPDVVRFIESNFNESPGYAELRAESQSEADDLLHAIASKASGVFLWVSLVVKSLLSGLTNGERLSKLRRRLDALPPDLEQLFQGMLDQIALEDREDASKLFQIVRAAFEPPTIMTLAWADEDDPNLPFDRAIEPLSSSERDAKSRRMRRRLKSHCRGLLEADRSSLSEGTVEWIHRTVRDFLYRHEVWSDQKKYTAAAFHPEEALCRSCLLQLKCANDSLGLKHGWIELALQANNTRFSGLVSLFVRYTHKLYKETRDAQLELYDELATTTKVLFDRNGLCETSGACWCNGPTDHEDGPFLSLATCLHIIPYVEARLARRPPRNEKSRGCQPLLQLALGSTEGLVKDWNSALCYRNGEFDLVKLLLESGADPNLSTDEWGLSPWKTLIEKQESHVPPDIMMEFLRHGADPTVNLDFVGAWGSEWLKVLGLQREIRKTQRKNRYRLLVRRLRFWG